ncbi:MAG TPA: cellulase family glycosylhydrolase [Flavisolibacter sp.]
MKLFKYRFFVSAALLLSILLPAGEGYAQGFLKASGQQIVDAGGKNVLLRGMGLGGWMLQEPYMMQLNGSAYNQGDFRKKLVNLIGQERTAAFYEAWLANFCTKTDIDSLASWGFNSIRLPMHYNLFTLPVEQEPVPGKHTWLDKGFVMVDSLLQWCAANKTYLILDLHAAPGGQGSDFAISDRDTTLPSLWQSEANKEKTIALWKKLAERYVNEPWIGGYDLINETNWGFQNAADKNGCAETANVPLRKLLVDITEAIRTVDTNHLIMIEANCWANNYKGVFPLWDSNMVVSFHKYWNDNNPSSIQQFVDYRKQYNVPVWMGESGENSNPWFRSAISVMEHNNIGWAWWPHKKIGFNNPFEIRSNDGYKKVIRHLKGEGVKPSADEAFAGLMRLAEDSKADRTIFHKDVVDAMFRQVQSTETVPFKDHRVPGNGKVYAVDFDLGPIGYAYYSKDSANYRVSTGKNTQWNKGHTYRNDAVDIEPSKDAGSNGYQVSEMQEGEWLQYTVESTTAGLVDVQLRCMAPRGAAVSLTLAGNENCKGWNATAPGDSSWTTLTFKKVPLKKGANRVRIAVTSGTLSMNYLSFIKPKTGK